MAGEAYLKIAASNMRRAIMDIQSEIAGLRHSINRRQDDIDKEIADLNMQISRCDREANEHHRTPEERDILHRRSHDLRTEIDRRRQQFHQLDEDTRKQISQKEQSFRHLEAQVREVEQTAAAGI